jgi:putative nucleotidyltransferase with HDIG domain
VAQGAGNANLACLESTFDLVIHQARGVDGALGALFQRLRRQSPDTLLLAGGPGGDLALGIATLEVAAQINAATLREGLEDQLVLHRTIARPEVQELVGDLKALPSVPRTYWELVDLAAQESCTMGAISSIIESDPSMSLKVLQLVNSAFFGLMRRISTVQEAVNLLGVEMLKGLALTAHIYAAVNPSELNGFSLDLFQAYSIKSARLARRLAGPGVDRDIAFTAGIVHDVGKLVLALRKPVEFSAACARVVNHGESILAVEASLFGVTHAEVGAYLLSTWGIPHEVVSTVAYHHNPSAMGRGRMTLLASVHAADTLIGIIECGEAEANLDVAFLERVGARVADWRAAAEAVC